MNDDRYIIEKLDKIDSSLTSVLVQQASLSEKLNQHVSATENKISNINTEVNVLGALKPRVSKLESAIGVIRWVLGIFIAIVIPVTAALIIKAIGG